MEVAGKPFAVGKKVPLHNLVVPCGAVQEVAQIFARGLILLLMFVVIVWTR